MATLSSLLTPPDTFEYLVDSGWQEGTNVASAETQLWSAAVPASAELLYAVVDVLGYDDTVRRLYLSFPVKRPCENSYAGYFSQPWSRGGTTGLTQVSIGSPYETQLLANDTISGGQLSRLAFSLIPGQSDKTRLPNGERASFTHVSNNSSFTAAFGTESSITNTITFNFRVRVLEHSKAVAYTGRVFP